MSWRDGRHCPICGKHILYSEKTAFYHAKKKNSTCMKCRPVWNRGKKNCQIPWNKGKVGIYSEEIIQKLKNANIGKKYGEETRRKHRLHAIELIRATSSNDFHPSYNRDACILIENYGKKHKYNFQHALNGGEYYIEELGYWVDGYDKEKNVVIEYYENEHKKTQDKDLNRINEIKNFLNCKIIILREWETSPEIIN